MKKSERAKASEREDGVDFISKMPDAILLLILSRLSSTKETIRSSILATRWRYLWTAIPSVDMHCPYHYHGGDITENKFKEFVYRVLSSRTADLDRFRLRCYNYYSTSTVCRWIDMAVTRNVKQLDLSFYPKERTEAIELPHSLVTCCSLEVLQLSLDGSVVRLPNITGFPALRVLKLYNVDLLKYEDLVKEFFQSCPFLEELTLSGCLMGKLVCISCPKLKRLKIDNNHKYVGYDRIKISCPKLEDLNLEGKPCNLFFESLDSLKQAVIEPISKGNSVSCESIDAACDPALPNLKTLWLETTLNAFTFDELIRILKCCPKLENLKLLIRKDDERYDHDDEGFRWSEKVEKRRLFTPDLKRVEFLEFNGEKPKVRIVPYEVGVHMIFTWGYIVRFSNW